MMKYSLLIILFINIGIASAFPLINLNFPIGNYSFDIIDANMFRCTNNTTSCFNISIINNTIYYNSTIYFNTTINETIYFNTTINNTFVTNVTIIENHTTTINHETNTTINQTIIYNNTIEINNTVLHGNSSDILFFNATNETSFTDRFFYDYVNNKLKLRADNTHPSADINLLFNDTNVNGLVEICFYNISGQVYNCLTQSSIDFTINSITDIGFLRNNVAIMTIFSDEIQNYFNTRIFQNLTVDGVIKEGGQLLSAKYYLATNPKQYINVSGASSYFYNISNPRGYVNITNASAYFYNITNPKGYINLTQAESIFIENNDTSILHLDKQLSNVSPTLLGCSGGSIGANSTDAYGLANLNTSQQCRIMFNTVWTNTPYCVVTGNQGTAWVYIPFINASELDVSFNLAIAGATRPVRYICLG